MFDPVKVAELKAEFQNCVPQTAAQYVNDLVRLALDPHYDKNDYEPGKEVVLTTVDFPEKHWSVETLLRATESWFSQRRRNSPTRIRRSTGYVWRSGKPTRVEWALNWWSASTRPLLRYDPSPFQ